VQAALRRLADRTGCEAIKRLTTCVRDAQRQGTDLAGALRVHSDTMRDQRELEGEEAAQKASVKILIPTLLFIFPAVFVVLAGPAAIRIHESFNQSDGMQVQGSP
jgi:tight adherence protein C